MMERMSKINCGIIYAVKQNKQEDKYKSIATFMSHYTDCPISYYTNNIITNLLSGAISDLLNHLEYPSAFWTEYWNWKQDPWSMNDFEAMCAGLYNVQVRKNGEYINGFRPFEDFEEML